MRTCRTDPEIVPGFSFAFGVGNQGCHQLQNVLFAVNVGEWVIVHGLFEVDGIQDFNPVRFIDGLAVFVLHGFSVLIQLWRAPLEQLSTFD